MAGFQHYANKSKPCPICGRTKHCRWNDFDSWACWYSNEYDHKVGYRFTGKDRIGFTYWRIATEEDYRKAEAAFKAAANHPVSTSPASPSADKKPVTAKEPSIDIWSRIKDRAERTRFDTGETEWKRNRIEFCSRKLRIPQTFLVNVPCYWADVYGRGCLVTPTYDGFGNPRGAKTRNFHDGGKLTLGAAGITTPKSSFSSVEPYTFGHEGPRDTLTSAGLGFCALGRDNNRTGGKEIGEWIHIEGRREKLYLAWGENDYKPEHEGESEQKRWPGLWGAKAHADDVANATGRPTMVIMPPEECGGKPVKDFHDWFLALGGDHLATAEKLAEIRTAIDAYIEQWIRDHRGSIHYWRHPLISASPAPEPRKIDFSDMGEVWPHEREQYAREAEQRAKREAEREAERKNRKYCPTPFRIWLHGGGKLAHVKASCNRISCPVCGELKKKHYLASVSSAILIYHLTAQIPDSAKKVHTFEIPFDAWEATAGWFRKLRFDLKAQKSKIVAEYIAIRPRPDAETVTVVATHIPPGAQAIQTHDLLTGAHADVRKLMGAVIETIPVGLDQSDWKPYLSTRAWKLIPGDKPRKQMKFAGRATVKLPAVREALQDLGILETGSCQNKRPWKPWQAILWDIRKVKDVEYLIWCLNEKLPPPKDQILITVPSEVWVPISIEEEVASEFHIRI